MKTLAQDLDVKVYGRGWEFPDARVVEGLEMLQASRAGMVHVNFPGTRAGYTNIKCGVFETVGSGRVLCTEEFPEMRNFFEYGEEIVPYRSTEDLVANIRNLLADPSRYERMRRRAFHRLLTQHLYEHRWLTLFEEIGKDLSSERPIVGRDSADRFRERLKGKSSYVRRIIVSGFYGARNVGDELILSSFRQAFKRSQHNIQPVVACEHPANVELDHGISAFRRSDLMRAEAAVKSASAVAVGGGGLWHDYTFHRAGGISGFFDHPKLSVTGLTTIPLMAKILGKPAHVFGLGAGPLSDSDAQTFVKFAAEMMSSITVRDDASKAVLESIDGWDVPVDVEPDAVYGYELPRDLPVIELPEGIRGKAYLIVNLRPWDREELDLGELAYHVGQVCGRYDLAVLGVPMQRGARLDEAVLREFVDLLPDGVSSAVVSLEDINAREVLGLIARSKAVLAMRLHMSLLAHRFRVPAVGLSYDPKVKAHFLQIGRGQYVFDLTTSAEIVAKQVEVALASGELEDSVASNVARFEAAALESMEKFVSRVAKAEIKTNPLGLGSLVSGRQLKASYRAVKEVNGKGAPRTAGVGFGFGQATVHSGSEKSKDRDVRVGFEIGRTRAMVKFRDSAPRKGDYVKLSLGYYVRSNTPHALLIPVHVPYESKHLGRLEWQLVVQGKVVHKEDIAIDSQPRQIELGVVPERMFVSIDIVVKALRNCEDWGWGGASRVLVGELRKRGPRVGEEIADISITPLDRELNNEDQ